MKFAVEWHDHEREPQHPPDPNYPFGIDIEAALPGAKSCKVALPYPARRCGVYFVECQECGARIATTTAGRPDDPRSIRFGCRSPAQPPVKTGQPVDMPKGGLFA
jgi:hypothetical protein